MKLNKEIIVPLIIGCALLMENINSTVIIIASHSISNSLHVDVISMKLGLIAYSLSLAIFIPASGYIADKYGCKNVFILALLIFLLSSIYCSISSSFLQFISARFLQGFGGALMLPVGRLIIMRTSSNANLVTAMNYFTMPVVFGPLIGPSLGGFIVSHFNWSWIFYINIPICILIIILTMLYIPNSYYQRINRFDWLGFIFFSTACFCSILAISCINEQIISNTMIYVLLITSGMLFIVYYYHSKQTKSPLLNLSLFKTKSFNASVLGGSITRLGAGAVPLLVALCLQLGFHLSAFHAGFVMSCSIFGMLFAKKFTPRLIKFYGFNTSLWVSSIMSGLCLFGFAICCITGWLYGIILVLFFNSIARNIQFTSLNTMAYLEVDQDKMSHATTIASTMQEISMCIGVSIGGLIILLLNNYTYNLAYSPTNFAYAFIALGVISLGILPFIYKLENITLKSS